MICSSDKVEIRLFEVRISGVGPYLLTGIIPISAIHPKKVWTFFCSILWQDNAIERDVICRQLTLKDLNSNSWTTQVRELLYLYILISFQPSCNHPRKEHMEEIGEKGYPLLFPPPTQCRYVYMWGLAFKVE